MLFSLYFSPVTFSPGCCLLEVNRAGGLFLQVWKPASCSWAGLGLIQKRSPEGVLLAKHKGQHKTKQNAILNGKPSQPLVHQDVRTEPSHEASLPELVLQTKKQDSSLWGRKKVLGRTLLSQCCGSSGELVACYTIIPYQNAGSNLSWESVEYGLSLGPLLFTQEAHTKHLVPGFSQPLEHLESEPVDGRQPSLYLLCPSHSPL